GARVEIEHEWAEHYQTGRNNPSALVCTRCPAVKDLQPTAFEQSAKKQTSSAGRFWGKSVIYGKEDDHATPYMTRYWIGRLRLHIFHRGDQDPDCHDHPWSFWTFPFTPYVEEVLEKHMFHLDVPEYVEISQGEFLELHTMGGKEFVEYRTRRQIVP